MSHGGRRAWGKKRDCPRINRTPSFLLVPFLDSQKMDNGAPPTPGDKTHFAAPLPVEKSRRSSLSQQELQLMDENRKLQQELARFKQQVASLQLAMRQHNSGYQPQKAKTSGGLSSIEMASTASSSTSQKHKISPEADKEILEMESGANLEFHESAQGLHHRNRPLHSPNHEYTALNSPLRVGPQLPSPEDGIRLDPSGLEEETFVQAVTDRAGWLVGLLVLQSMSSFIIARNESLLQRHGAIIQFLTMLVGAGGNAGNQASVRVIRGLAVGSIDLTNTKPFLQRELLMGMCLSIILGVAGFGRALIFYTPWPETFAITTSLFIIVAASVVIGALLPLGMRSIGIDPAHSRYVATLVGAKIISSERFANHHFAPGI